MTGILIVDDHALVREGLVSLINDQSSLTVVGQASSGEDAIRKLRTCSPDLLLVDLHMEGLDGADVIRAAKTLCPDTRIVALTAYTSSSYVHSALSAGAHGYVVKSDSCESILLAIKNVIGGMFYISPEVTEEVVTGYILAPVFGNGDFSSLTPRERELVEFFGEGNVSNKDVAQRFHLSERTVERHKTNIFRKLKVSNSQELIEKLKCKT